MRSRALAINRYHLVINTNTRKIHLYDGEIIIASYPVGVGKSSTPTPHGNYKIINKILRPGGILGTRWMGLNIPHPYGSYGIHGTSNPSSIGGYVSLGCIRMFNHNVEELFSLVSIGTPVMITGGSAYNQDLSISESIQNQKTYTIKAGDTLWNLAQRFGVPVSSLITANLQTDPNKLYPGQKIVIPSV